MNRSCIESGRTIFNFQGVFVVMVLWIRLCNMHIVGTITALPSTLNGEKGALDLCTGISGQFANPSLNPIGREGLQHLINDILVAQQCTLLYPCPPVTSRQSNGFRFVGSLAGAGQVLAVIKFIEFDRMDNGCSVSVANVAYGWGGAPPTREVENHSVGVTW